MTTRVRTRVRRCPSIRCSCACTLSWTRTWGRRCSSSFGILRRASRYCVWDSERCVGWWSTFSVLHELLFLFARTELPETTERSKRSWGKMFQLRSRCKARTLRYWVGGWKRDKRYTTVFGVFSSLCVFRQNISGYLVNPCRRWLKFSLCHKR